MNKITSKQETLQVNRCVLPIHQDITYSFCFTGAEMEILKIKDDGKIERETNLDRHEPNWDSLTIPDPHTFSLPTTFKKEPPSLGLGPYISIVSFSYFLFPYINHV
jgi:hypothetical protein